MSEPRKLDMSKILSGASPGAVIPETPKLNQDQVEDAVVTQVAVPTPTVGEVQAPVTPAAQSTVASELVASTNAPPPAMTGTFDLFSKVFGESAKIVDIANKAAAEALLEIFKATKGVTYRIGFVSSGFISAWAHYQEGIGRFKCTSGLCDILCQNDARQYFGNIAIVYDTDNQGKLLQPFGYKIKAIILSSPGFISLSTKNSEFPIAQHDYLVGLDEKADEKYQDLDWSPTKDCIWRSIMEKNPEAFQTIMNDIEKRVKYLGKKIWGKELTEEQLKEAFKMDLNAGSTAGFDPTAIKI